MQKKKSSSADVGLMQKHQRFGMLVCFPEHTALLSPSSCMPLHKRGHSLLQHTSTTTGTIHHNNFITAMSSTTNQNNQTNKIVAFAGSTCKAWAYANTTLPTCTTTQTGLTITWLHNQAPLLSRACWMSVSPCLIAATQCTVQETCSSDTSLQTTHNTTPSCPQQL